MNKISITPTSAADITYQIFIGKNTIMRLADLMDLSSYSKIAVISDKNLINHLNILEKSLSRELTKIIIQPGENQKNIDNIQTIWQQLQNAKFDRQSLIINLGGGVITDMGGFAASTYMRGIDFVNIPTTLLSQVDASVGGKTGIDFSGIKNLIGTFKQPKMVVIDVEILKTLPDREYISGFAEIIKHGLIADESYFERTTSNSPLKFPDDELIDIITRSCEIKKQIVEKDVNEKGLRKILNFGHTIGHAIEAISITTDTPLLHGEAISLGIISEAKISNLLGFISENDLNIIKKALKNAGLPDHTEIQAEKVIEILESDKKTSFGRINWTLLKSIGEAIYDISVDEEIVIKAIEYVS